MTPSERQIRLFEGDSVYSTLADYLNRKIVRPQPFSNTQSVSPSAASHALIDNTVLTGNIAIGLGTAQLSGGVLAAELAGAIDTAATTAISSAGSILNLVDIRDASTNNEVTVSVSGTDRKVWGLIQTANGTSDGTAVGAPASENLQISFVYFDASNALVLTALTGTFDFQVNKIYAARNLPNVIKEGGVVEKDVIDLTSKLDTIEAIFTVTTAFAANEVITISTGAGAGSGVSTPSGDYAILTLPTSSGLFASNARVFAFRNGVVAEKGAEVIWDSATTFHFTAALAIGEKFSLIAPKNY
jgi:hypothetical protein